MNASRGLSRFVRLHLAAVLAVTCVTAWFSYSCFHNDEYFQIIELTRLKLGDADPNLLPWEYGQRMRPWLQPFIYWVVARMVGVLGVRDIFDLAFVFRLLTGLANVGALALFLRTSLAWMKTVEEQRAHIRVATLLGFLPYLFVRTSSESGSMAALTAGFAIALEGAEPIGGREPIGESSRHWSVPLFTRPVRAVVAGFLFGLAFEMRFQTAFAIVGVLVWLVVVGRGTIAKLGMLACGGVLALGLGVVIDRWGYGGWTFTPLAYFRSNVLEGAASSYGTSPPFAYLWIVPANVFLPVVAVLLVLAMSAWLRCSRHPLTWVTLPFFVIHGVIAHKEERFLFPIAVLSTALVTMALGPSFGPGVGFARPITSRLAKWYWPERVAWPTKLLAVTSFAGMLLLAFVPLNWRLNVRFTRYLHDTMGDELHATALPEISLLLPAFHPRVYDVDHANPEELVRRIEAKTARKWLIADRPILHTGTDLDRHATLVYSELPCFRDPQLTQKVMGLVDRYNRTAARPLRFRSLYRIDL